MQSEAACDMQAKQDAIWGGGGGGRGGLLHLKSISLGEGRDLPCL